MTDFEAQFRDIQMSEAERAAERELDKARIEELEAIHAKDQERIVRFEERLRVEEAAKKRARSAKPGADVEGPGVPAELRKNVEEALARGDAGAAWDQIDHFVRYDPKLKTLLNYPAFKDEVLKVYGRYFRSTGTITRRAADAGQADEARTATGSTTIGMPGGMGRLALLFIDLDDFKRLNDTKGHLAGDVALQKAAEVLSDTLREADIKGRFGGEELIVVIETENDYDHFRVAEKIRRLIERAVVEYGGEQLHVTASIGAAELQQGETLDQLTERANWAMKYAKAHGKNKAAPAELVEAVAWVTEHKGTKN